VRYEVLFDKIPGKLLIVGDKFKNEFSPREQWGIITPSDKNIAILKKIYISLTSDLSFVEHFHGIEPCSKRFWDYTVLLSHRKLRQVNGS
jgi:hypothetical protein